jgi:hypothetical protein
MFTPPPSKEDLAKMKELGFSPEDFAGADVEVWPENERAYFLFSDLRTQWRMGMGGPYGLDYTVLYAKLDRMRLEPDDRDQLEDDIRTMEFAALGAMAEKD